ncbi:GntR family transcriptional regulator [Aurantimonas endophytica]|uniref:DNA-binding GntR family transcriptional regulator n=1 Tax=Aurantimonas endophytica TaxID=1522175 RepID=A0A7W6HDL7_9HYPH|nr:GntR family transcriptional regulator [Aurantimonas endophytica]MBB4003091.1 DNA-binding GntR family transcriptional regulator [Aurantimonas endophytica]MCO6403963.1 FCD domain-containing protein [Aurantimonas endophytica]
MTASKRSRSGDRTELPPRRGFGALTIRDRLRDEILSLHLRPGQLLDEVGLAERFAASRSPVREALVHLQAEGLVDTLPNKGSVVAGMNIEEFPQYIDALDLVQRAVTRLAAELRTDTNLERIRREQERFRATVPAKDALGMIQTNMDFHLAISEAARNPYLHDAYRRLLVGGRRMLRLYYQSYDDDLPPELPASHDRIIEAIERRDVEAADRLAREHAEEVHSRFIHFMGQRRTREISLG